MTHEFEEINRKVLRSRTVTHQEKLLSDLYTSISQGKVGNDAFLFHLEKLITVLSHLAEISLGNPKSKSIRNNNFTITLRICMNSLNDLLERGETSPSTEYAALWPMIKHLVLAVSEYNGDSDVLRLGVWLAFRAAKISMLVLLRLLNRPEDSMFYLAEEEAFASKLPYPIAAEMPLSEQLVALTADIQYVQGCLAKQ